MPKYSDAFLVSILQKSARKVNRKLCLTGTATALSVDNNGVITPDDEDLKDIVLLQAECLISQTEYQQDLRDNDAGVVVKDGEQTVDTTSAGVARGTFFNSPNSPCGELDKCIAFEKLRRSSGFNIW